MVDFSVSNISFSGFLSFYDSKWNIFGFWTVIRMKSRTEWEFPFKDMFNWDQSIDLVAKTSLKVVEEREERSRFTDGLRDVVLSATVRRSYWPLAWASGLQQQ